MRPWVRTVMIVVGIMVMLLLLVYTDPSSLRDFFDEKTAPTQGLSLSNLLLATKH